MFTNQKGRNIEVYVDDTIVKSKIKKDHIEDLKETFATLRQYQMKLNLEKCVFGVRSGKFLGFMVSERGIDANPDKINALLEMKQPKSIRDIQRLTGRMAALTRFISKSADKALPFFVVLRQNKSFEWGKDQADALEMVRNHLKSLPTVARPEPGEYLHLYISASPKTVASVLIVERAKQQMPIYFVSHVHNAAERRYLVIEKMAFALVIAARKLRPYFDAHPIEILTNHPLEKSLQKMGTSGRLLKWAVELSEYELYYKPRVSIKAQALLDFVLETSYNDEEEELGTWQVLVDGSATLMGSGAGIVITAPNGEVFEYALKFKFKATNNEAEYEAAITGIQLSIAAEAKRLVLKTDSQLVSSQFRGEYEARELAMIKYLEKINELTAQLQYFEVQLVPRAQNSQADALARLASSSFNDLERTVMVEVLKQRSIDESAKEVHCIRQGEQWYEKILTYLLTGALPIEKEESRKIKKDSVWFILYQGQLYKRGFSFPLQRCITAEESTRLIEEIHEETCGNHLGARALSREIMRRGYYWPSMNEDASSYVKKCEKCQKFAPTLNRPPNDLTPILNPVPFAQWGMDIVGPFPSATGNRKFLLVGVDYFTKWIEAESVTTISAAEVRKFIWKNIFTRFGLPGAMVFYHGSRFDCKPVKNLLTIYKVKFAYAAVCHPQSNGQAEAANKQIVMAIKKKIEDAKGLWADLIPEILWANRTTVKEATGESPFHLVFGTEAVIPAEVGLLTFRIQHYCEEQNDLLLRQQLDFLPEVREKAAVKSAA
ncbi:uncharacterized protein LOC110690154 [Chenopodium quinoa]|uniref:uncharacterized protein LOC110690154 n=1 Tax=Chenopodium quinoa TaxID=63459 RepID=UPI000B784DD1|nr:uncharacterized protein LOC110690154 [Chenopodium quinoa]